MHSHSRLRISYGKISVHFRRRQAQTIERKISNLTRALSDGYSSAITSELAQLESQLADTVNRLADSEPLAIERKMRDMRKFVESRLADLRGLLNAEAAIVRFEIAKHVQKIILTPSLRDHGICWVRQHGAGGPACTTRRIEFEVSLVA